VTAAATASGRRNRDLYRGAPRQKAMRACRPASHNGPAKPASLARASAAHVTSTSISCMDAQCLR
jgi:hypothetical protein